MSKKFRWSRKTYRHAHHLSRVISMYDDGPEIVKRYRELWATREDWRPDPLLTPLAIRLDIFKYGIPF